MKIRFHHNSVRVRLTQTEVARLGAGDCIEQDTSFSPTTKLMFSIGSSNQVEAADAMFYDNCLAVMLPKARTVQWATGADVGIASAYR
jgi:hypothetical protein